MHLINRREMVATSAAALLLSGTSQARENAEDIPFSWETLVARARTLARTAHVETPAHPRAAAIGYDAFNKASFRPDRTLWDAGRDDVAIRLFPLSSTADRPVMLHIVEAGRARPLRYDPAYFDLPDGSPVAALGPGAGFSGFRVMNAARDADWLVYMGASYFRAAGAQKQYGLSARAVAIDTSKGPEEFPRFTHFWLERAGPSELVVHALLDGPSLTGAYRFRNRLDRDGVHQDIDAALFPRRAVAELGLMPMTSMFWYDQAHRGQATDWRPEIHDSDGLLIRAADGAAHFRPLINPPAPRLSQFAERNPAGFGLLQRDRDFDHYQDDGVFYDRRPSLFATPKRALGTGRVGLYEFRTDSEYTDNIASYWLADAPVAAGKRIDLSYRLDWQADAPIAPKQATIVDIRRGVSDADPTRPAIRLVIDFAGLPLPLGGASAWSDVTGGQVVKSAAYPIVGQTGLWRMVLDIVPAGPAAVDVRAQLRAGGKAVSEMLHYPVLP